MMAQTPTGFLEHDDAAIRRRRGNGVTADAAGFLGKPFDEGRAITDLGAGFVEWLALFEREE